MKVTILYYKISKHISSIYTHEPSKVSAHFWGDPIAPCNSFGFMFTCW